MTWLFDLGYLLFAACAAPWWLRKKRGGWRERFGHARPLGQPDPARPRLMIHAVSVGETNLIRPLVDLLARDYDLIIASTTDTGAARARELYADRATLVRYPLDASWMVRRFLNATRPQAVALVELELWPTFARACRRRGVPICILNGRLSDRSYGRYRLARPILGPSFSSLAFVAAQDETYAARFAGVGVAPGRVSVAGTMKWDAATVQPPSSVRGADDLARSMGIDRAKPLIVAGSTAPDEHALLHAATPPGVQLLCAPRRPEWFDGAARDLPGCVRRSATKDAPAAKGADRFVLDSIGELRGAYALADVAVIGRSFGDLHGSDPMEPAGLGRPVVIGPAVDDFRETVRALHEAGGLIQTTREALAGELARLLSDRALREEIGARAVECVRRNQGAAARHAALLRALLPTGGASTTGTGGVASAAPSAPASTKTPPIAQADGVRA